MGKRLRGRTRYAIFASSTALVVLGSMVLALMTSAGASALPPRFDMGVYDPTANQAGRGRAYSRLEPALAMKRTRETFARFVRIPINWDRVVCGQRSLPCTQAHRPSDPKNPTDPAYKWRRNESGSWYDFDADVQAALNLGLEPVLTVFRAPAFAECDGEGRRPGTDGRLHCPNSTRRDDGTFRPNAKDYAAFMTAVSRRYPEVRFFQIWNEPNFFAFLTPVRKAETVDRYRDLVREAYTALKAEDATDKVVAGGTAPNGNSRASSPKEFLRGLISKPVPFDVYSTHPYTPGGPRTSAPRSSGAVWMGNLGQVKRILKRGKAAGTVNRGAQYWVTEFSWDSAPPDCRVGEYLYNGETYIIRAVPSRLLTRWVAESAYRMWRHGFSAMIWAQLKDFPTDRNASQGGLYRWGGNDQTGRAKPARAAFRFPFVAYPRRGGAYVWGRLPTAKPGRVVVERRTRGSWRRVAEFKTSTSGGLFWKRLSFDAGKTTAMRARAEGKRSPAFRLDAPPVPAGIQPFGCTRMSQWR